LNYAVIQFESRVTALEDRCVHHKTRDTNESLAEQNYQTSLSTLFPHDSFNQN